MLPLRLIGVPCCGQAAVGIEAMVTPETAVLMRLRRDTVVIADRVYRRTLNLGTPPGLASYGSRFTVRETLSAQCRMPYLPMTQAPHIRSHRRHLLGRKLRPAHRGHGTAILLWLRHSFAYRLRDSGITPVRPQPILPRQSRTQGRTLTTVAVATHACRSAHLTVINPLAKRHDFRRRPVRHGNSCVGMRTLRRLGGGLGDFAGGLRPARARRPPLRAARRASAVIHNAIDPPAHVIGNIQRAIRPDRQPAGPMGG